MILSRINSNMSRRWVFIVALDVRSNHSPKDSSDFTCVCVRVCETPEHTCEFLLSVKKWRLCAIILTLSLSVSFSNQFRWLYIKSNSATYPFSYQIMADWSETRSLLTELEQLFLRDNDISDVLDVAKMAKEIEIHRESNLMSAKALIKGNIIMHSNMLVPITYNL